MAAQLAHFELRERIGLGAMGAVYRAEDSRLGRTVAVKILLPEVAEDVERRSRFLREARAAAGLNHPNIAMIFEVGEAQFDEHTLIDLGLHGAGSKPPARGADELPFFAMEHVPGQDLGTLMSDGEGLMEIDRVADLSRQIARALEAAHGAGIVHRDLKPGNVRVTPQGRVKLLDFGLAKLLSREKGRTVDSGTGSQLTLDGMVMGTLPYLAPEQLQSLKVDGRADLFALGVMLYEMLTGDPPFPSSSMVEYARALLIGDVPRPKTLRDEIPDWLDDLVMRLLDTDPARRPMSAAVVRMTFEEHTTSFRDASGTTVTVLTPEAKEPKGSREPRRLPAAAMTAAVVLLVVVAGLAVAFRYSVGSEEPRRLVPGPPAVATLPLSSSGDAPPLALGVVAYLHQRLEMLPGVAVRDLDDTMRYQSVAAGFSALGRQLQADWVLSGQVLDAEPLRIRLVWIRSADGRRLWSEDVDLSGDGILRVQDELFDRVLKGNDRLLTVAESQPSTRSRTALRSYLLALARLCGARPETAWAAFERSLEEDPLYFWALIDSARCVQEDACRASAEAAEIAEGNLRRALELQPGHPVALLEAARREAADRRHEEAAGTVERLLAQHPSYVPALAFQAELMLEMGQRSDSRAVLERALRRDPGSWRLHDQLGLVLLGQGDLQAAAHQLAEADRLAPDRVTVARTHRFQVLRRLGRAREIVDLQAATPLRVDRPVLAQVMGWAHETLGNSELARSMFGLAVELDPEAPQPWYELARYYERSQRDDFARASFNEARKIWQQRLAQMESRGAGGRRTESDTTLAEARGWYAFLEAKRGRCDKALRAFQLDPANGLVASLESEQQVRLVAGMLTVCERPEAAAAILDEASRQGLYRQADTASPAEMTDVDSGA